jgi:hypothetical protein
MGKCFTEFYNLEELEATNASMTVQKPLSTTSIIPGGMNYRARIPAAERSKATLSPRSSPDILWLIAG